MGRLLDSIVEYSIEGVVAMPIGKELKKVGRKIAEASKEAGNRVETFVKEEVINPVINSQTISTAKMWAEQMQNSQTSLLSFIDNLQTELQPWLPCTAAALQTKLAAVDSAVARLNDMVHNQEHGIAHMKEQNSIDIHELFASISTQRNSCEESIQEVYNMPISLLKTTIEKIKHIQQMAAESQEKSNIIAEAVAEECNAWTSLTSSSPDTISTTIVAPMQNTLAELNERNTALQQYVATGKNEIQTIDAGQANYTELYRKSLEIEGATIIKQANFDVKLTQLQQQLQVNVSNREAIQTRFAAEQQEREIEELAANLGLSSLSSPRFNQGL